MEDRLAQILLNSKKVMNKVESNNFSQGNVDKRLLSMSTDDAIDMPVSEGYEEPQPIQQPRQLSENEYKHNVSNSRLPDVIKQAMLENQIVQPNMNIGSGLSLDFTEKIAKQMEKQGLKSKKQPQAPPRKNPPQQIKEERVHENDFETGNISRPSSRSLNESIINEMKPLIKEIIQSTLEATIERVLMEKFAKQEKETLKINETLQIRVGDSLFVGKITGVKQVKK
jgi:hypothetical protein